MIAEVSRIFGFDGWQRQTIAVRYSIHVDLGQAQVQLVGHADQIEQQAADAGEPPPLARGVAGDGLADLLLLIGEEAWTQGRQGAEIGVGQEAAQLGLGGADADAAAQARDVGFAPGDLAAELVVTVGPEPGEADQLKRRQQREEPAPASRELVTARACCEAPGQPSAPLPDRDCR